MEHAVNETLIYVISLACDVRRGDVPAAILAVLIELGFQTSSDGFGYLRKAIFVRYQSPEVRMSEIYNTVVGSSDASLTVSQVEQAILSSIESAWKIRDQEKWDYFFSERRTGKKKKPGNKEFIAQIACFMELWFSHCQEVSYGIK